MSLNRSIFFDHIRSAPFGGSLTQMQVDGISRILDEWERRALTDIRHLAYMLATVFHETARAMQPVKEAGPLSYLQAKPYWPWIGMGLVQVTWETNGRKFGAKQPEDLLSWPVALRALFDGMAQGVFTGRKLSDYFSSAFDDPVNARRIINGTDRAALIAGYHGDFLAALKLARFVPQPATAALKPPIAREPPVTPAPQGLLARFFSALRRTS